MTDQEARILELFPPDRAEAIRATVLARAEVLAAVTGLPSQAFETRLPGRWSVKEILAHLASRDWRFVNGLRLLLAGEPLPWPHPGWHPTEDDLDRWNQDQVRMRAGWSAELVLHELGQVRGAWYGLLLALPHEVFWDARVREWDARRARHDQMHLPGIRERIRIFSEASAR